jgi:1,4-alpha-glucan branching enzyme
MQSHDLLAKAQCANPFTHLGPHYIDGTWQISAYYPGAMSIEVKTLDGNAPIGELQASANTDVFTGNIDADLSQIVYKLAITTKYQTLELIDPYQFTEEAYYAVHFIDHLPQNLYQQAGAQLIGLKTQAGDIQATRFAVYAPNASAVSLIGDFNQWDGRFYPMQKTELGYWVLVVPGLGAGQRYKYQIKDSAGNELPHKADPLGFHADQYPSHASRIYDHTLYQWQDTDWQEQVKGNKYQAAMSIYEVHLGSWKRPAKDSAQTYLSYKELAVELVNYVKDMGYTHIELLPVSEFPYDGSWGYQPVGLFAPTSRFGHPDEFKYFVDVCHQNGIGVIIDWVPAHFPEDGHGLARFDGSHVYEYEDPRRGWHPDWNSCIYDFGKGTVRQFLVANALYWLDKFHVDGLRVDAVASMLYLDYSRNDGEWIPNVDGGNENYEAISLLRWMNQEVYKAFPNAMTIAEESTSFPKVSRPVFDGGLGFGFKWNMGWMHDSLEFISKDPAYRKYHHGEITFSMMYAFDENFVLPLSHDEVVHGKGSLLGKMPGDEWQQAANLRSYAAFMYGHPGKKLNFMGIEIGQASEWNHDASIDWQLLDYDKHAGIQTLYRELNQCYVDYPALHEQDHVAAGFSWIDYENAEQSILSFVRIAISGKQKVYVICNFTPVPREAFRLGVQDEGCYKLLLNTDANKYWGSDYPCKSTMQSAKVKWNNQAHSIEVNLPPLSTLFILYEEENE